MAPLTHFKLNNGLEMPTLGLGTWQSAPGQVRAAVAYALSIGYTLIDTAYCYGNEKEVGQGIKDAIEAGHVKREDIFVVTKVWSTYMNRVELGLQKSLENLGLEYIDMLLEHWPVLSNPDGNHDKFPTLPDGTRDIIHGWSHIEGWKSMEKLLDTGKVRGIGVCNYSQKYLEELLPHCSVIPAVNQIENHPDLPQQEIVDFCNKNGIHVMAYSPLGSTGSPAFNGEAVKKICEQTGAHPARVLLSWHVARGSTVLAKSVTPDYIRINKTVIELAPEHKKLLDDYAANVTKTGKFIRIVFPPFKTAFGFPDKP